MVGVAWERGEAEVFVKCPGFVVFGVNRECTDAGDVRGLQGTLHRVFQQPGAEAFALPGRGNGKACEEHDGNGMPGEAFDQPLGRGDIFDLADDKRVVADDGVVGDSDVGLRRSCLLVLKSVASEKAVECFPAAIEFIDSVAALQLFNPEWGHTTPPRSNTLGSFKSFAKRCEGRGGADRAF